MEIRIDPRLENGIVQEGTGGTVSVSAENLITFTSTTGTVRKTRWFELKPGETVVASIEMKGVSASLSLYTSSAIGQELMVGSIGPDSNTDMKLYKISYTLPMNSTATIIGVAFAVSYGIGKFYRPIIDLINKVNVAPSLIACALITMPTAIANVNFPIYGIASVTLGGNMVTVQLSQRFRSTGTRPILIATDGTIYALQYASKLVGSNIAFASDGTVTFLLYYVDSTGAIIPPPTSSNCQIAVYY